MNQRDACEKLLKALETVLGVRNSEELQQLAAVLQMPDFNDICGRDAARLAANTLLEIKRQPGLVVSIADARQAFVSAFREDPDFRRVYVDNVACVLMDECKAFRENKVARDDLADKIIMRIFQS